MSHGLQVFNADGSLSFESGKIYRIIAQGVLGIGETSVSHPDIDGDCLVTIWNTYYLHKDTDKPNYFTPYAGWCYFNLGLEHYYVISKDH